MLERVYADLQRPASVAVVPAAAAAMPPVDLPCDAARPAPGLPIAAKCGHCAIRSASMCQAVPQKHLDWLAAAAVTATVEPGGRIIVEGDAAENFYTLTAGTAKLLKMLPDGRQQITSFADPGDVLGLAFADRYAYGAEAIDRVTLCRFSHARLRRLIEDVPEVERRLLAITRHELVLAHEQMLLLGCKLSRERLASFLLARARRYGFVPVPGRPTKPVQVALPMTRSDIGDYLGLRIETVSRTFTQLRTAKLIANTAAGGVAILDANALAELAAGG